MNWENPDDIKKYYREYYKNHKNEKGAERKEYLKIKHLSRKFGITIDEYDRIFEKQNGVCAICNNPETKIIKGVVAFLSVDHDHKTGKVRGLLCSKCNMGIGYFNDDPFLLNKASQYLDDINE
jgi:hypothetical protein